MNPRSQNTLSSRSTEGWKAESQTRAKPFPTMVAPIVKKSRMQERVR